MIFLSIRSEMCTLALAGYRIKITALNINKNVKTRSICSVLSSFQFPTSAVVTK